MDDGLGATMTCGVRSPVPQTHHRGGVWLIGAAVCVWGGRVEELTVLSTQFCFEPETDLKNKVILKNKISL